MKDKVANGGGSVNGEKLNFRVGPIGSALPMVFFIIWAIVCSMFDIANEQSLIVGAVIGLGLGLFVYKLLNSLFNLKNSSLCFLFNFKNIH